MPELLTLSGCLGFAVQRSAQGAAAACCSSSVCAAHLLLPCLRCMKVLHLTGVVDTFSLVQSLCSYAGLCPCPWLLFLSGATACL